MFEDLYEEIKYPYTEKNLSYKIFKYANSLLIGYFVITYFTYLIALYFKNNGNIARFNNILTGSYIVPVGLGTIAVISYLISVIFRKKI